MGWANDGDMASLTDAVSNFGTAYAATQESLRSNKANITAIQGQLQMLCQALGNGQPPRVSTTTNSAHVADAAVDNNAGATSVVVVATVAVATTVVVLTTTVATRKRTAVAEATIMEAPRTHTAAAAAATMVAAAQQTVADTVTAQATPPHRSNVSKTGTTAAHMVAMWTTTTPARHAPAQKRTTSAR